TDDLRESLHKLESKADTARRPLVVADAGRSIELRGVTGLKYKVELESGEMLFGTANPGADGSVAIPAIRRPGYHRLLIGERRLTLAVCPLRCPTVEDRKAGHGIRPWG